MRSTRALFVSLLIVLAISNALLADEIRYGEHTIEGQVVNIGGGVVEFKTKYGVLKIPLAEVETVSTEKPVYVIHGEIGESHGRVLGLEDGKLLVGKDAASAERIDTGTIRELDSPDSMEGIEGWFERLRNRYHHWSSSLDLGISYSDKTTDETKFNAAFAIERRKKPTRFVGRINFVFGKNKPKGEESEKTDNEIRAYLKGEYDVSKKAYAFMTHAWEYDEIERLSTRWVGGGGLGYRFFEEDTFRLQVEGGGSYVYREFFGGSTEEYPGAVFGAELMKVLELGAVFDASVTYLPSFDDWIDDYLINAQASLSFPVYKRLSLKVSVFDTYDSDSAEGTDKNEFTTILALSWSL